MRLDISREKGYSSMEDYVEGNMEKIVMMKGDMDVILIYLY